MVFLQGEAAFFFGQLAFPIEGQCRYKGGPPLHTGAADSGRARKVPQLNKQGAPRSPWGRWGGWRAGLWRFLRWVKLPLLIEQARADGIEFFY